MRIFSAALSDTGARRVNEDAFRVDFRAVVADGMGGHGHGDTASRIAVDAVVAGYAHDAPDASHALRSAVEGANAAVFLTARRDAALTGMGTTCTAIAIRGSALALSHVGDSRLYLVRDARIYAMTEDHSLVTQLVSEGVITAGAARVHAERNVLLRAIGTSIEAGVSSWQKPFPLRPGDRLLLTTDGLHGTLDDEELLDAASSLPPDAACRALVALALARGSDDNVTLIVIDVARAEGDPS
jgi:serine/threonine protein phosphatase PrpC